MRTQQRPGRNEPCWCGSGKKYKKCHLGSDEAGGGENPRRRLYRPPAGHLCLDRAGRDAMRRAGAFNAELMDHLRPRVRPGVTTGELDRLVYEYTVAHGHVCATLGYNGFPKSCCTSVNEVVCHGIPGDRVLGEGDLVNLDLTTIVDGWHGDQSETFLVGEVSRAARQLVTVTLECLYIGIDAIGPGSRVIEIGRAISNHAHEHGFSVVRDYQGHGIGCSFHQDPGVPHFPDFRSGRFVLEPGMCFTIEPMINAGAYRTRLDKRDGWTVTTADGSLSAQFEHTILMTETGPEILTVAPAGPRRGHVF